MPQPIPEQVTPDEAGRRLSVARRNRLTAWLLGGIAVAIYGGYILAFWIEG